jgi:hypothetical protein
MRTSCVKNGLVMVVILLFIGIAFSPITQCFSVDKEILETNYSNYPQQNKELTREHLKYLICSFIFLKFKWKLVISRIIFEIIKDGNATNDEVQKIVKRRNIEQAYILADVKTRTRSDGILSCMPRFWKTYLGPFHTKGFCNVVYEPANGVYDLPYYGWKLQIDGKAVSEKKGLIFGFFGEIFNGFIIEPSPPEVYRFFKLDGYGLVIFHGI